MLFGNGSSKDKATLKKFPSPLKRDGLRGVRLINSSLLPPLNTDHVIYVTLELQIIYTFSLLTILFYWVKIVRGLFNHFYQMKLLSVPYAWENLKLL